jgi:hypothetical protein
VATTTTTTTTTTTNTTTYTTPSLNATAALEWIMSFSLGCEFSSVGGREQVLEQLRNKHILFIGDSILRYQFREHCSTRSILEQLVSTTNTPIYALSTRKHLPAPLTSLAMEDDWKIFNRTAIIEPLVELFLKEKWPMNVMNVDKIHFWGWIYDRLNAELLRVLLQDEPPT